MQINSVTEFSISGAMVSSQGEASANVYEKIQGKRATWYVSLAENRADNILSVTGNKEGMGGAKLGITLSDGTVEEVHAPWCSNADSLLEDTGLDVRDTHTISYIICKEANPQGHYAPYNCTGVLEHMECMLTSFDYPDTKAEIYANTLGQEVFLLKKTSGGGSAGRVKPTVVFS